MAQNVAKEFSDRAKLAEKAERFDDMVKAVKELVKQGNLLSTEERRLFLGAYKNAVGERRSSWRSLSSIERSANLWPEELYNAIVTKKYKDEIEHEIIGMCRDVLDLLDTYLIPKSTDNHDKVVYLKMSGDYYSYLAEILTGGERTSVVQKSEQAYQEALNIAEEKLLTTDSIRLGLVLNFSVFYYEIAELPEKATELAKQALDKGCLGISEMAEDDPSYKDTSQLLQLLKDNLHLWSPESSEPESITPKATDMEKQEEKVGEEAEGAEKQEEKVGEEAEGAEKQEEKVGEEAEAKGVADVDWEPQRPEHWQTQNT